MLRQLSQAESDLRKLGEFIHDIPCNISKIFTLKSPDKSDMFLYSVCKDMRIICFVDYLAEPLLSLGNG
jgi:hypothetical protein